MKQNFALTLSLMGGLMLLASACVKEKTDDEKLRPVGSEIIFAAATSYENDDRTRTVYTGKDESGQYVTTNSSIERIDWENNDRVSIIYVPGSPSQAEYKVTNVVNPNSGDGWENNLADVVPSGSDKLVWAPAGSTDIFYAMYPTANGKHPNNDAHLVFSNNTANVQGVIPSSQSVDLSRTQSVPVPGNPNQTYNRYLPDMQYAYMVGYADDSCRDGSRVTIPFTPAVTAFNFIFKAASSVTVTGFEMSTVGAESNGTALAGDFNFNITGAKRRPDTQSGTVVGAAWNSNNVNRTGPANDNGKTITVSFSQDITLSANQYLDFTVFTLPIMQKGITIKFHLKNVTNGVTTNYTKSLDLKDKTTGNWHEFAAGKKHVVTNDNLGGDSVTYYFTQDQTLTYTYSGGSKNYTVKSYKKVGTKEFPVSWQAYEYREYFNGDWTSWTTIKPEFLTTSTAVHTPSATAPSANMTESATLTTTPLSALGTVSFLGTESAPYDLSTKSTTHGGTSMNTANCYVVSAPGWYCFPMVYGNAIKKGAVVETTYKKTPSGSYSTDFYLTHLRDHKDSGIKGAYVDKAYTVDRAELLWQDCKNLITGVSAFNVTVSGTTYKYIKFYVDPAKIVPSNAVIAAKDSGGTILWSWHIWVTKQDNATYGSIRGKNFMKVNLGWRDAGTYKNVARQVQIRLKQGESSGKTVTITLTQSANTTGSGTTLYNTSPHYQWGRKDPFLPPKGLGQTGNESIYNAAGTAITTSTTPKSLTITQQAKDLADGIKNPMVMYSAKKADGVSEYDWLTDPRCNLWNHNQTRTWNDSNVAADPDTKWVVNVATKNHGKTVYDPCPYGYTVPTAKDFENFQTTATNWFCGTSTYPAPDWSNDGCTMDSNFWGSLGQRNAWYSNSIDISATNIASNYNEYAYFHTSNAWMTSCKNAIIVQMQDKNAPSNPKRNYLSQAPKSVGRSIRCVKE